MNSSLPPTCTRPLPACRWWPPPTIESALASRMAGARPMPTLLPHPASACKGRSTPASTPSIHPSARRYAHCPLRLGQACVPVAAPHISTLNARCARARWPTLARSALAPPSSTLELPQRSYCISQSNELVCMLSHTITRPSEGTVAASKKPSSVAISASRTPGGP